MKKNILLTIITLVAAIVMTSCDNREYSKELANQASREAKLVNIHQHPVDGEIANGILKFRCVDSFYVDWAEQHFAGTHFCNSQYQIYGAESNTIASLEGCYDVDANGNIVGTELSLSFIRDEVEQALATFRGIDDPVDFSRRISETDTCHYEPFKACFDKTNRRMTVYGLGEHGDTAVATGDWYGVIVHNDTTVVVEHDTVIRRDTIITHDTIHHHDTIIFHDTIVRNDTVITTRTTQATTEHISWNPTAVMQGGYLCVYGTDRLTVVVKENGVQVSSNSTTYQHRTRYAVTGISGLTLPSGTNTCVNIVNGQLTINGNVITTTFVDDVITDASVIVNGVNYKSQLTPCHATAVKWCFNNGNAVCHFDDANTTEIATYTTTYTVETPSTVIDLPGTCKAVYISDSYTGNCAGRTTWMVALYTLSDGSHVEYQVQLTSTAAMASLNASSFSSASVSADGFTRFNNNKNNSNWGLCRITTAGTPSAAGYCTYSSDASVGIYEATINDGVNRVHCNAAGYANPDDELEHPVHFRNVNGGTTHVVATNVHGVDVNITLQ